MISTSNFNARVLIAVWVLTLLATVGCGSKTGSTGVMDSSKEAPELFNAKATSFKVTTKGSIPEVSSSDQDVLVRFDRIELKGRGQRTVLSTNIDRQVSLLSKIDLFEQTKGLENNIQDIREIRLHLASAGNILIGSDGKICELQTPSAQHSGLKIKLPEGFDLETGKSYELQLVFDLKKSIVRKGKGNGGCLLKPVIHGLLRIISAVEPTPIEENPEVQIPEEPVAEPVVEPTPAPTEEPVVEPSPEPNPAEEPVIEEPVVEPSPEPTPAEEPVDSIEVPINIINDDGSWMY